jgi:arginine decarboxylase
MLINNSIEKVEAVKESYRIHNWGNRYFTINAQGNVGVKANGTRVEGDLFHLVQSLVQRGIEPPILIRFNGVIRDRMRCLQSAFNAAIHEFNYHNSYCITYPIKVNPQRHVVELIQKEGRPFLVGLEVGSKPELLAVLTLEENPNALLLCNGYKDAEYIELALLASKLGRRTIIIIEQVYEVKLVVDIAKRLGMEMEVGFRFRPTAKGTGRWETSSGEFAKFGLDTPEIMICLEQLKQANLLHWLKLFHFHIGSQITSIESIKKALQEASCMYAALAQLCSSLAFFDAGGGLGIDYDGSKTTSDSSINYSLEEYARDVVSAIKEACQNAEVPDPMIITESGRALVAHHTVLVIEVIDIASLLSGEDEIEPPLSQHDIPVSLYHLYQHASSENCLETLHNALQLKEMIVDSFILNQLSIEERAYCERIYQHLLAKIQSLSKQLNEVPEEIENLNKTRLDMYFCNFSVFQSLPDSWAIGQLFPIMPIHKLTEDPNRHAVIADLSCDSDGKINHFIGQKGISHSYLPLHKMTTSPYYLGIFLVGAYQEILGGLHNLFGDTNVVHVELTEEGTWEIKDVIEGDTIEEVLHYTQYNPDQLLENLRGLIEKALKAGRLSTQESAALQKKIKQSLESYTYLVV